METLHTCPFRRVFATHPESFTSIKKDLMKNSRLTDGIWMNDDEPCTTRHLSGTSRFLLWSLWNLTQIFVSRRVESRSKALETPP